MVLVKLRHSTDHLYYKSTVEQSFCIADPVKAIVNTSVVFLGSIFDRLPHHLTNHYSSFMKQQQLFFLLGSLLPSLSTPLVNSNSNSHRNDMKSKLVYGKDDSLFGCIERQQGGLPFGHILDSGTGIHSLRWIATLEPLGMKSYTAVTADESMRRNVENEAADLDIATKGTVVIGNWFGKMELPIQQYDTILADYLIGAMDGFSPFKQEEMIQKLLQLLKPGGRLYIVGLEPIPDKVEGDANIICKVRQVRDACILLASHRCYREFPVDWITNQIRLVNSTAKLMETNRFPILYKHATIVRQINVGRSKIPFFPSKSLGESMKQVLDSLEQQSLNAIKMSPSGSLKLGFDYVVSVEKLNVDTTESCQTTK